MVITIITTNFLAIFFKIELLSNIYLLNFYYDHEKFIFFHLLFIIMCILYITGIFLYYRKTYAARFRFIFLFRSCFLLLVVLYYFAIITEILQII